MKRGGKLKLRVRTIKARGLPPTNFDGSCDSHCIITLEHGGLESSDITAAVPATTAPEWGHKTVFKDVYGATALRITVRSGAPGDNSSSSGSGGGDVLGQLVMPRSILSGDDRKAKWAAEWRPLALAAGMSSVAGEIYASATLEREEEEGWGGGGAAAAASGVDARRNSSRAVGGAAALPAGVPPLLPPPAPAGGGGGGGSSSSSSSSTGAAAAPGTPQSKADAKAAKKAAKAAAKRSAANHPANAAQPNTLLVEIIQARGLRAEDINFVSADSSDPYATLRCLGASHTTAVVEESLCPVWGERARFVVTDGGAELEVEVRDKDLVGKDDFLGQLRVALADPRVVRGGGGGGGAGSEGSEATGGTGGRREWFPLLDENMGATGECGEIELALDWVHEGASAEAATRQEAVAAGAAAPLPAMVEAAGAAAAAAAGIPAAVVPEAAGGMLSAVGGVFGLGGGGTAMSAVAAASGGGGGSGGAAGDDFVPVQDALRSGSLGTFEERRRKRGATGCGSKRKGKGAENKGGEPGAAGAGGIANRHDDVAGGQRGATRPTAGERAAAAAAAAAERARLEKLNAALVRGDYEVRVHLIEARGLKGEDLSGLSDPVVEVSLSPAGALRVSPSVRQCSSIKEACRDCVFDEMLFFQLQGIGRDELEDCSVAVAVYDADTFGRNDLIGLHTFDLLGVYFREEHELYVRSLLTTSAFSFFY